MKYLHAFLASHSVVEDTGRTGKTQTCVPMGGLIPENLTPQAPAKPAEPPPAFPEPPDDWAPAVPDRSVWRSVLATWSIPERQRWGELANRYEAEGQAWDAAEWRAFRELTGVAADEPGDPAPAEPDRTNDPGDLATAIQIVAGSLFAGPVDLEKVVSILPDLGIARDVFDRAAATYGARTRIEDGREVLHLAERKLSFPESRR